MPNYCCGTLKITTSEERMKEIVELISGIADDGTPMFDFAKVIPIPDNVSDEYEWRSENWGSTRGGFDLGLYNDSLSFWTAWSPCSPVIEKLAEMFPEACFDYWYDESNMGFCGQERYENGKLVYIMDADMHGQDIYDEDDPPTNFVDGQEIETKTVIEENDSYKIGKIVRIIDEEECRTLIEGFFCEGKDDNLRDKLYETIEKKGARA